MDERKEKERHISCYCVVVEFGIGEVLDVVVVVVIDFELVLLLLCCCC